MQHRHHQSNRLVAVSALIVCVALPGLVAWPQAAVPASAVLGWTALAIVLPLPFIDEITQPAESRTFWTSVALGGAALATAHAAVLLGLFWAVPVLDQHWGT